MEAITQAIPQITRTTINNKRRTFARRAIDRGRSSIGMFIFLRSGVQRELPGRRNHLPRLYASGHGRQGLSLAVPGGLLSAAAVLIARRRRLVCWRTTTNRCSIKLTITRPDAGVQATGSPVWHNSGCVRLPEDSQLAAGKRLAVSALGFRSSDLFDFPHPSPWAVNRRLRQWPRNRILRQSGEPFQEAQYIGFRSRRLHN